MSDTQKTFNELQLEASQHVELAAFHLYLASQVRLNAPLPEWDSDDARDMRVDARYRANGAHKRGDQIARSAVVERVAVVLAVANGDHWPECTNQIHGGLSDERRAVLGAMRRQRYRHHARIVCAEIARFYEIDPDTEQSMTNMVERAKAQQAADAKLVASYRGRIGQGEVVAIGAVRG